MYDESLDDKQHIQFLRNRWVTGASEWLAGKNGCKENDKLVLGYSDNDWDFIWTTMREDGAWAVPSIRDGDGNVLKENQAPELFLKFIAHDLKCNIVVIDLYNNTVEFCSGNQLLDNNAKFDSPLILYTTGSHFQSVFPKDHEFFIDYAKELQRKYSGNPHSDKQETKGPSEYEENNRKQNSSNQEKNKRKTTIREMTPSKRNKMEAEDDVVEISDCISRREEIKKIKAKDRTESEKREFTQLKVRIFRHQKYIDEARKKIDNEKDRMRMGKFRADPEQKRAENEKQKARMDNNRKNEEKKNLENEKQKIRMVATRKNEEKKRVENETQKVTKKVACDKKRSPYKCIAVKVAQDQFAENDIAGSLRNCHLGSLFDKSNQCQYCKAFRFKRETNFCCSKGDVVIPKIPDPPKELQKLFNKKSFTDKIRGYNNILAMASIGLSLPDNMKGPNFKVQGKVYHRIGSLLPADGEDPKFLQLYFYDSDEATDLRLKVMPKLDKVILEELTTIIEKHNPYIKSFKAALEYVDDNSELSLLLIADKKKIPKGEHSRRYNLPQGSEVAAIMPGEGEGELEVLVKDKENKLKRINRIHRSYDPLLYVIFDPFGTDGFTTGLKRVKNPHRNVSLVDFYSYRIQVRPGFNPLLRSKRCFQQYLVDQGAKIEGMRMRWVTDHQKTIKAEKYNGLLDAAAVGDLAQVGRKIILPPSITGSPRFYVEKYQDCMAIVQKFGKPTLFITMTCNPEWKEIQESLNPGETAFDRPDICTRVFKLKNDLLIEDIAKNEIFGKTKAHVGTLEKRIAPQSQSYHLRIRICTKKF